MLLIRWEYDLIEDLFEYNGANIQDGVAIEISAREYFRQLSKEQS
jgi:hypothetical protein